MEFLAEFTAEFSAEFTAEFTMKFSAEFTAEFSGGIFCGIFLKGKVSMSSYFLFGRSGWNDLRVTMAGSNG